MLIFTLKYLVFSLLHVSVHLDHPQGAHTEPTYIHTFVELISKNTLLWVLHCCSSMCYRLCCVCWARWSMRLSLLYSLKRSIFCLHFNNIPARVRLVELYFDMKSESRSTTQKYYNTILAEIFQRIATVYTVNQHTTAVKATKLN